MVISETSVKKGELVGKIGELKLETANWKQALQTYFDANKDGDVSKEEDGAGIDKIEDTHKAWEYKKDGKLEDNYEIGAALGAAMTEARAAADKTAEGAEKDRLSFLIDYYGTALRKFTSGKQ